MLIHLLQHCTSEGLLIIKKFLSIPIRERKNETATWILDLMHQYGSIAYSKNISKYMAGAAIKEFYTLFSKLPDSTDKSFIESIIRYMINRDY